MQPSLLELTLAPTGISSAVFFLSMRFFSVVGNKVSVGSVVSKVAVIAPCPEVTFLSVNLW